jgi:predicted RNase H-like HicB family nuclease
MAVKTLAKFDPRVYNGIRMNHVGITNQLKMNYLLPVSILKEGDCFVAYTPALDLSTSGKSYTEVKKRFAEVVNIFFEELLEKGTLSLVLTDLGWQKVEKKWLPPTLIAQETQSFAVPITA